MAMWLIEEDAARDLQRLMGAPLPMTAEMLEAYRRSSEETRSEGPRCLSVSGPVAAITVKGVLTKGRDPYMYWYDVAGTTYRDIQDALAIADKNPEVKQIVLNIDSPGGTVDGMFEAIEAVRSSTKKTVARCSLATSAAYGIASACDKIEAVSASSRFGSIGVATRQRFWSGETVVDITNTDSPDKTPNAQTEEGKAVIRKMLDATAELFFKAIATGRGCDVEDVRTNYGRGAVFLAADAKRAGMVDAVPKASAATKPRGGARASSEDEPEAAEDLGGDPDPKAPAKNETASAQRGEEKNDHMDLNAFKAAHPALFESIVTSAKAAAVAEERDRVGAHLAMGEASGAMETAIKAITEGTAMTQTLMAQYTAAGMKRSAVTARGQESEEAERAVSGGAPEGDEPAARDMGDLIVALDDEREKKLKKKS